MAVRGWMWAVCAVVGLTAPAHAQLPGLPADLGAAKPAAPAPPAAGDAAAVEGQPVEGAVAGPPWVSQFCVLSFFTQGADRLDLRASPGEPCFDTGRGDDVFRLDPENFPEGVRLFSDRGRSVIRLSDGPSLVFDQESTAAEIRTGRGDDTIRLGVGFVGAGTPVVTPETRVFPGGGRDLLVIGSGLGPAVDARHVANARVFPESGALALEAGCGRPNDPDSLDAVVENADASAQLSAVVRGCGLALRNHAAPTVVDQVGGRFIALLRPEGEEGVPGAFFEAKVSQSSGLNFTALNPRADTVLDWSGFGDATLQVEARLPASGGTYAVSADGAVFARVLAQGGAPVWDLVSTKGVELVIEGTGTQRVRASVAAPTVSVEWRPEGEVGPPVVEVRDGVEAQAIAEVVEAVLGAVASSQVASSQVASAASVAIEPPVAPAAVEPQPVAEGGEATPEQPAAPGVRAPDGTTEAGRLAMVEGRPVELDAAIGPPRHWGWAPIATTVDTQQVDWRIKADAAWCATIGPMGGEAFPCTSPAVFVLDPGQALSITRADGTRIWPLSATHAATVRWSPDR